MHWHQRELLKEYADKFFAEIRGIYKERTKEYSNSFFSLMFPWAPEDESLHNRVEELLRSLTPDEKALTRHLKEELDDLKRAKSCRDFASK